MSNRFSKLLASALILLSPAALALDTGWIYAGSASNVATGDASWTNTANATGNNTGTYSSVNLGSFDLSDSIQLTNFNFAALPDSATIDGIQVAIYRQRTGGDIVDDTVRLVIEGSVVGSNKGVGSTIPTVAGEATYGGASDKWSLTPTAAQLKASNSGVRIAYENTGSSADARVYRVGIKIYYTPAVADWWDSNWSHRIEGTIDATYVDEEIPVVPVWIPSSATAWFSAVQADGDDIRVLDSTETIALEYYIVDLDTAAPHCMLLVNVSPIIDTVTDAPLRVYSGNASAIAVSSGSDVFSGTNTLAMWALTETGGTNATDITGNGYTATSNGSMNSADNVAGHRTGMPALDLDGTDDHFSMSSTLFDALRTAGAYTIGMWADVDSTAVDQRLWYSGDFSNHEFFMWMDEGGTGPSWAMAHVKADSGQINLNINGNDATANTWTWPVATWDGTTVRMYKNAVERLNSVASSLADNNASAYIGRFNTSYADAQIAMPFVDSVARSANYLATMYDSWFTANFITFGAVETAPSSGNAELWRGFWFD